MSPQRLLCLLVLIVSVLLGVVNPARGELISRTTDLFITDGDPNWIQINPTLIRTDTPTRSGDTIQSEGLQNAPVVDNVVNLGTLNLTLMGPIGLLPSIMIDPEPMNFELVDGAASSGIIDLGDISDITGVMGGLSDFIPLSATGLPQTVSVGSQTFMLQNLRLVQTDSTMSTRTYTLRVDAVPTGAVVPEPSSWALLTISTLGILGLVRRRSR